MPNPAIYSQTKLYFYSGSAENEIPGITNIAGPTIAKTEVDISNMSSTAKEFKSARLADPGTLTVSLQYAPLNGIHAYITSQSFNPGTGEDHLKILFSDASNWRFTGSFMSCNVTATDPSSGILTAEVAVRLSGAINFASGSLS